LSIAEFAAVALYFFFTGAFLPLNGETISSLWDLLLSREALPSASSILIGEGIILVGEMVGAMSNVCLRRYYE